MSRRSIGELTEAVITWNPAKSPDLAFKYVDLSSVASQTKRVAKAAQIMGVVAPSRARQLIAVGDILVSTVRPNLNAVAVVPDELDGATASTGFTVLRPGPKLDGRYLFHWVRSDDFIADMVRKATGASYPAVSDRIVKESTLPVPSIEEQRRIAAILDHADALRAKRRQVLAHLDALTQSIFHDMFGVEGWPIVSLTDLAAVTSGITKGRRTSDPVASVPYLAVSNVQAGHLNLDVVKTIDATEREIERLALRDGDLVLTEGGDPDKLGRGTVWRSELPLCLHQNHIFRVRLAVRGLVRPDYLAAYLASLPVRQYFLRSAKQTTGIASINMTQLKALPVAVPPLDRQEVFLSRTERLIAQREVVERAFAADEELFASLQSRAFKGEL